MRPRTLLVVLATAVSLVGTLMPAHAAIGEPATLTATIVMPDFGSTFGTGTMTGTFTGLYDGTLLAGAGFSASFVHRSPEATCPLQSTAVGTYTIDGFGSNDFDWVQLGTAMCMWIRLPDGTYIHICGPIFMTTQVPCLAGGQPATITFAGAGANAG